MGAQDDNDAGPGGGERRRLQRAPGDRYRGGTPSPGKAATASAGGGPAVPPRAVAMAVAVAIAGCIAFFVLGQLDLGPGLLAVAAFAGWITAVALVGAGVDGGGSGRPGRTRIVTAALLAGGAIALAMGLDWAWAIAQGGVLGPLDYVAQRYGPAALLEVLGAATVAGMRAH